MNRIHAWTSLGTVLGLSVISPIFLASGATAELVDQGTYHDTYVFEEENFCGVDGLTVEDFGVSDGRYKLVTIGTAGLPVFSDSATGSDTLTNVATGAFVTSAYNYKGHSLKVTDNGDGTLTVLTQNTDNTVIYDEAGNVLARDTGVFRYERTFYHMGTISDPSDDVRFGDPVIIKQNALSIDFCAAVVPVLTQ